MGTITEDLAAIKATALEAMEERAKLLSVNAELVAALEAAAANLDQAAYSLRVNGWPQSADMYISDARVARAALAKAKGAV